MHPHLRSFLEQLRAEKDLVEIDVPVDPHLELAEIHRRVLRRKGPPSSSPGLREAIFPSSPICSAPPAGWIWPSGRDRSN